MSKELDALERLYKCNDDDYTMGYQHHDYKLLQEALQRLEAIDNANPSEALKSLEEIDSYDWSEFNTSVSYDFPKEYDTIKQTLIKAQEQERVLIILKEKRIDLPYLYELFECIKQGKDTIESALKQYNDTVKNGVNTHQLTQEEFDLLKKHFLKEVK